MRASVVSLVTIGLAAYSSSSVAEQSESTSPVPNLMSPNLMSPSQTKREIPEEDLTRMPVRDRPRYGYEPIGYRVGPIFFYPQVLAGLRVDSNVFASSTRPQSDLAGVLAPKLTITTYSPRFEFKSDVGAVAYRFRRFNSEDHTDVYGNFQAKTEVTQDFRLEATGSAAHLHEDRTESTAPSNAASPVPYTDLRGQLTATKDFNRVSVLVGTTVRNLTYENVRGFNGELLDQASRSGTIMTAFVRPSYEITKDYRVYMLARYNTRDYEGTGTLEHDSKGFDLRGGLQFTLTPLIFGSVEGGYLEQTFNNPLIPTVTGPVVAGKVQWLVTPLTTVSVIADRHVSETASPGQEARLDTSVGAAVDHELLRNVILSAGASAINQDFRGTSRKDDLLKFTSGVDYWANRFARVGVHYDFIDRRSSIPTFNINEHVMRVNVTAQY